MYVLDLNLGGVLRREPRRHKVSGYVYNVFDSTVQQQSTTAAVTGPRPAPTLSFRVTVSAGLCTRIIDLYKFFFKVYTFDQSEWRVDGIFGK